ncbi:MAG: hypothetical protein ICV59_04215 [Thermoleophilia bacterium]|nr:hypothetical protein [Thermoleophilia bacterium]
MTGTETATDARCALLARLIDHAPLYPPASLPLDAALADHERARMSDAAWMVNRFVCPASRLAEVAGLDLRLTVVVDVPWAERPPLDDARIEAIELPLPPDLSTLREAAREVYVELPPGDVHAHIRELARHGLRAKVRCGGETIPPVGELAAFVRACRATGVPFKATAGLHHAVRRAGQHGFVNVLAAAVFGREMEALAEADPRAFELRPSVFRWRDGRAASDELVRVRREVFVSIGSCSFSEPVDELRTLGLLPL